LRPPDEVALVRSFFSGFLPLVSSAKSGEVVRRRAGEVGL
jgi:hypothetical protein